MVKITKAGSSPSWSAFLYLIDFFTARRSPLTLEFEDFYPIVSLPVPNRISQEIVDAYLTSAQLPHAELTALSFVRGDLCFDLAEFMPQLTTPTAIIWGKQSQLTDYSIGEKLAKLNPQAVRSLEILEDVGLTPQLELPAVMIGMVQKFLDELE